MLAESIIRCGGVGTSLRVCGLNNFLTRGAAIHALGKAAEMLSRSSYYANTPTD